MKSVRVALPNTYHHDALLRGTWCSITGRTMAPSPARSSSHWLTDRIKGTRASHLAGKGGKLAAADPELALADLVLVLEEPARRRSRGARAVLVVDAAVTGAHEELGLRNHRTGQPRCAQLTAKTWKRCPSTRRTQHATLAEAPSHWTRNGFSYWANRVCPTGKLSTPPSLIQDSPPPSRRAGARMYPTTGMPTSTAPRALRARPSLKRKPRLEELCSERRS